MIYVLATADTKGEELAYVADQLVAQGIDVCTVDVGTASDPVVKTQVSRHEVAAMHPRGAACIARANDRGEAITAMSEALVVWLKEEYEEGRLSGAIGLGGSGGTALIAPAFRALPIGIPKLLVSTVASGNTAPYVGCTDLTLMYSVVDVAGLNRVSRAVLANAAGAIAGMARRLPSLDESNERFAVGMTMFGVTTQCVNVVRQRLEATGYDPLVFHATGTGGQAMEKLVESGMLNGVLDITTTEVADEIVGGVFPAGPHRMEIILQRALPYVISFGALDMVNFGARDSIPQKFCDRQFHSHNAQVTLMRTTVEENRQAAQWIAGKLLKATSPVVAVIPLGGVSALDAPGKPFWNPEADRALFETFESLVAGHPLIRVERRDEHINDPAFADALVQHFLQLC